MTSGLSIEDLWLSVGRRDLIGVLVKYSSIVDVDDMHLVGMGVSLVQGIVSVDEIGG